MWSDVHGILQGLGQEPVCSDCQPRGRQGQHFSSLDCVTNPYGGPVSGFGQVTLVLSVSKDKAAKGSVK